MQISKAFLSFFDSTAYRMKQPKLNYSSQCQLLKPCLNIKAVVNFDALLNMKKYFSGSKGYFASQIVLTYCEKNCSGDRKTFWPSVSNLLKCQFEQIIGTSETYRNLEPVRKIFWAEFQKAHPCLC